MIRGFFDGVTAYLKAVGLLSRYRLWFYIFIPALISVLLGILIFGFAWSISDDFGRWFQSIYPWEWGGTVLKTIASVFGSFIIITLGLILFKNLVIALASPIMSPLSEKIEKELSGNPVKIRFSVSKMFSDLVRGLRLAFRNIIRELGYTFLLFLVGLIPFFSPFVAFFIFIVQAYYVGFGNMDYTMERHFRVKESIRFVRQHRGLAIGNGTVFLLLLFTGIGFLFALPLGAIAATTETVKRV